MTPPPKTRVIYEEETLYTGRNNRNTAAQNPRNSQEYYVAGVYPGPNQQQQRRGRSTEPFNSEIWEQWNFSRKLDQGPHPPSGRLRFPVHPFYLSARKDQWTRGFKREVANEIIRFNKKNLKTSRDRHAVGIGLLKIAWGLHDFERLPPARHNQSRDSYNSEGYYPHLSNNRAPNRPQNGGGGRSGVLYGGDNYNWDRRGGDGRGGESSFYQPSGGLYGGGRRGYDADGQEIDYYGEMLRRSMKNSARRGGGGWARSDPDFGGRSTGRFSGGGGRESSYMGYGDRGRLY